MLNQAYLSGYHTPKLYHLHGILTIHVYVVLKPARAGRHLRKMFIIIIVIIISSLLLLLFLLVHYHHYQQYIIIGIIIIIIMKSVADSQRHVPMAVRWHVPTRVRLSVVCSKGLSLFIVVCLQYVHFITIEQLYKCVYIYIYREREMYSLFIVVYSSKGVSLCQWVFSRGILDRRPGESRRRRGGVAAVSRASRPNIF